MQESPWAVFRQSIEKARSELPELCRTTPLMDETVVAFATADRDGRPSLRQLLVKEFDETGFYFYTNFESRKAMELAENPWGALCFYWAWVGEQVRIEGRVHRVPDERSDAYFETRPRGSQLGAWASLQSKPLESAEALEQRLSEIEARFQDKTVPRPPNWGGFCLQPERFEFWKQGAFRLHDRTVYEWSESEWKRFHLYP